MKLFVPILIVAFFSLLTFNLVNYCLDQEIDAVWYEILECDVKQNPEIKKFVQSKYNDDKKLSERDYMAIQKKLEEIEVKKNKVFLQVDPRSKKFSLTSEGWIEIKE
ncbi:hypothetical protein HN803_04725 [candidate division WWE3 bacterium]|jgi:hypothetical protein|nr:hypothetical protein [Candidatus Scalindua sp.]MBT7350067.1 hypothetical protein [candidate division WWE3 bacterium]